MELPADIAKQLYIDRDAVRRLGSAAKPWLVRCDGQVYRCSSFRLQGLVCSAFDLESPLTSTGPCAWLATSAAMTLEDAEQT